MCIVSYELRYKNIKSNMNMLLYGMSGVDNNKYAFRKRKREKDSDEGTVTMNLPLLEVILGNHDGP